MSSFSYVARIIAERDGMAFDEALELVEETAEEITDVLDEGYFTEVEDILADNLGLELDYLPYLLF